MDSQELGKKATQHNTTIKRPQIDKQATLGKFTDAQIRISGWCRSRGINRGRFYQVINNKALLRRDCFLGQKVIDALKREGLLVLVEGIDSNHTN